MSWNQWHSGQSSWPSWGRKLPTPRKPSKQHVEDSFQGSAESNVGLPASFKPTGEFYDTQEAFGLTFPRRIQASAWATKHGLAGRSLKEIRLHELTWQGWSNHNLRALTQGRYVSINKKHKGIKEATFVSFLLQHVREHKLDFDQISECFCADSGIQVTSSMAENAKNPSGRRSSRSGLPSSCSPIRQLSWQMLKTGSKSWKSSWPNNANVVQLKRKSGQSPLEALGPQSLHSRRARLALSKYGFRLSPALRRPSQAKGRRSASLPVMRLHPRRTLVR